MISLSQFVRGGPVVEIGSGHRPLPFADVLVDKFLEPREREGALAQDQRPLIVADVQDLPFVDGAFAYSICCHVIEHAEDIHRCLDEIQRVSQAGYLETPSALFELLEPHRDYHRWMLRECAGVLDIRPKTPGPHDRNALLEALTRHNLSFRLFNATNPSLRATRLDWHTRIPYTVGTQPFSLDEAMPDTSQSARDLARALAQQARERGEVAIARGLRTIRPAVDISPFIRCSRCHGALRVLSARVVCDTCQGSYPRQGSLFFLGREHFKQGVI
ncbi:MAG: methyltransferase domain-containing protein [Pseudomonadota bacterium]